MGIARRSLVAIGALMVAVGTAATAQADPDIDFANQLHGYGIYGQRDYNAWLAKIACKRLDRGVDGDAYASEAFIAQNLPRTATQSQAWQFLGAALSTYCPDHISVLQAAAQ